MSERRKVHSDRKVTFFLWNMQDLQDVFYLCGL